MENSGKKPGAQPGNKNAAGPHKFRNGVKSSVSSAMKVGVAHAGLALNTARNRIAMAKSAVKNSAVTHSIKTGVNKAASAGKGLAKSAGEGANRLAHKASNEVKAVKSGYSGAVAGAKAGDKVNSVGDKIKSLFGKKPASKTDALKSHAKAVYKGAKLGAKAGYNGQKAANSVKDYGSSLVSKFKKK